MSFAFGSGAGARRLAGSASLAVALMASCWLAAPALAQNNVTLENLRISKPDGKSEMTIRRVEVTDTNLSRDEVASLFSAETKPEDARVLLAKMRAAKVSIPEAVVTGDQSRMTLRDFSATKIDSGRFEKASLAGMDGTFESPKGEQGTFKGNGIELEGGNLAPLLEAGRKGEFAAAGVQLSRFTWNGFEAKFPDKIVKPSAPGGNLYSVRLASLTGVTSYENGVPVKVDGAIKGLVIEPPATSGMGKSLADFGYKRLDLGFDLAAAYTPGDQTLRIGSYKISGVDAGSLDLSGVFGKLPPAAFTAVGPERFRAVLEGNVSQLTVGFVNGGLFENALAYFAKQQKKSVPALKAEWSAMATQILPLMLGGDPSSLSLAQSLSTFIETPKSLTVSLKARGEPVPLAQLQAIRDPGTFLALVEINAKANGQ